MEQISYSEMMLISNDPNVNTVNKKTLILDQIMIQNNFLFDFGTSQFLSSELTSISLLRKKTRYKKNLLKYRFIYTFNDYFLLFRRQWKNNSKKETFECS